MAFYIAVFYVRKMFIVPLVESSYKFELGIILWRKVGMHF